MKILGMGVAHDSHTCVLDKGELVYYLKEESITGIKRDAAPIKSMIDALHNHNHIDLVAYSSPTADIAELFTVNNYKTFAAKLADCEIEDYAERHHLCHAAIGFYNSGFDEAYSVVIDSQGSIDYREEQDVFVGRETESIFEASYPADFKCIARNPPHWFGITRLYSLITNLIGENDLENGKLMGLSAYGNDTDLPSFFNNWEPTRYGGFVNCVIPFTHWHRPKSNDWEKKGENFRIEIKPEIDFAINEIIKDTPWLEMKSRDIEKLHPPMSDKTLDYQEYADLAKKMQKESEDAVLNFVFDNCDFNACKNITFSGGYALNCLANFRYTQELPPDVNIYIEPVADDAGIAIGAAKHAWHKQSGDKTKRPFKNIYQAGPSWDLSQLDVHIRNYK